MSIQPLNVAFQKRYRNKYICRNPILYFVIKKTQTETDACPVEQLVHEKKQVDEENGHGEITNTLYKMNNDRTPQSTVNAN